MSSTTVTPKLFLISLLGFVLPLVPVACTKAEKKESGGAAEPAPAPTPEPSNPCLRLQDEDDEEEDDEESADDDITETEDTTTGSDDEEVGSSDDCGDPSPSPSPTPSPSGDGDGGGWDPGPGLEGCAEDGKAWVAVKNGGPGECGPALVSWCCSEAEILKQFPSYATKLQAEFDKRKDLKLYHCSYDGAETRFHWAMSNDSGIKYSTVFVKAAGKVGGTAGAECVKVTSADLGLEEAGDDGAVEVGDDIPESIGAITDTSKAGMLAWAQEHNVYTSRDNAIRTTTDHGRVKGFYSANLKTSMTTFATKHPVNAIALLELYGATGTDITGYAIMAKAEAATGEDSWLFYKIEGGPTFTAEPTAYGLGVDACVTCHTTSTKDFIKRTTLP